MIIIPIQRIVVLKILNYLNGPVFKKVLSIYLSLFDFYIFDGCILNAIGNFVM